MKRKIIFVSLLSIIFAAVVIIVVLAIKNPTPPGCIFSVPSNATAYYGSDKFLSCARVKPIGIYDGDFYDYKAAKDSEGAKEADKNSNGGNSKTKYIIVKCEIITDYYKLLCDGETVNFAFYLGNTKEFDQNKYDDFIKLINESDSLVIFSHGKDTEKQLYSSVAGENVRFENISAVPISDSYSTIQLFPIADESVNFNGLFSVVPGLEEKLSFTEDIKNYFFKGMSEDELEESVNTLYELSISAPKNNKAPRTIHGLRPDIYYRKMTGEELSVDDLLKKGDSTSFLKVKLINRYDGYYSPKSKTAISSDDVCRVMECEVIEDCYGRLNAGDIIHIGYNYYPYSPDVNPDCFYVYLEEVFTDSAFFYSVNSDGSPGPSEYDIQASLYSFTNYMSARFIHIEDGYVDMETKYNCALEICNQGERSLEEYLADYGYCELVYHGMSEEELVKNFKEYYFGK